MEKKTVLSLQKKKEKKEKIVSLTAYDYFTASLLDELEFDIVLVGDSAAMVFAGQETTIPATMDEMLYHTKAVTRAVKNSFVIADMPFMSYQTSIADAVYNAGRFLKEGLANAVKLEGGAEVVDVIKAIVRAGIPVLGHIGLTPQSVNKLGGFVMQGKTAEEAERLLYDAKELEQAGCFGIVLECVPSNLANKITNSVSIPVIGIGSGKDCDGQILVVNDVLGLSNKSAPKFAKKYMDAAELYRKAFLNFKDDVINTKFPLE